MVFAHWVKDIDFSSIKKEKPEVVGFFFICLFLFFIFVT